MPKTSYAIKPPSRDGRGGRRSFAIQEVKGPKRRTLRLEALDAINRQLQAGQITPQEAAKQVEEVRDALYRARDAETAVRPFSSENAALVDRYWQAEYGDRDLVDPETMKADLNRAVAAVGVLSLLAAPRADLQAAVNAALGKRPNIQRRAVARLNQLLLFAGRDFRLRLAKPVRAEPLFLTWDELTAVLPNLAAPEFRLLAQVAWVTGCRVGEIFAISSAALKPKHLWVATQIDSEGEQRATKTRTGRKVRVLRAEEGRKLVAEWAALAQDTKDKLRQAHHSTTFKAACRKTFPKLPAKHCRFHDLRHSYAISLITRGVPLGLVAQSLGNSVAVCEMHYSGFVLQDEGIETIDRILDDGPRPAKAATPDPLKPVP
jgi:integrase